MGFVVGSRIHYRFGGEWAEATERMGMYGRTFKWAPISELRPADVSSLREDQLVMAACRWGVRWGVGKQLSREYLSEAVQQPLCSDEVLWGWLQDWVDKCRPVVRKIVGYSDDLWHAEIKEQLGRRCKQAYMVEIFLATPLCYVFARSGHTGAADIVEIVFVMYSMMFQWVTVEEFSRWDSTFGSSCLTVDQRFRLKESIMGVPIGFLQIREAFFEIISTSPNFITALQATILAGSHASTPQAWILLWVVLLGSIVHCVSLLIVADTVWDFADGANLHYLGKHLSWRLERETGIGVIRFINIITVKNLKWWAKVSLVTATWHDSTLMQRYNGMFGMLLGGYSIFPALQRMGASIKKMSNDPNRHAVRVLGIFQIPFVIEMMGRIFMISHCPSNHFSIFRLCFTGDGCFAQ